MTLWMYYETDGDAGYYAISLFSTQAKAEKYKQFKNDAYGGIQPIELDINEVKSAAMEDYKKVECPDCGSEMISRSGKFGKFWGCKNYPECKGTRDSMGRSKQEREEWKAKQPQKEFQQEEGFPFKRQRENS